jgi:hypothetical protein
MQTSSTHAAHEQRLRIGNRYVALCGVAGVKPSHDAQGVAAVLGVAESRGSLAIDLDALEHAETAVFGHDVVGMLRYLDTTTGRLVARWAPRCTQ